ncbi:hypothetical protein PILCRDRAFT_11608 [Piloderma croceum F 1598]|uniref:Uncharacterized protein n=1 Tax=Piloderma croceum (strain F 1598) TaxID=765440 RepID=A0A0C3FDI9_PILCF|nr:hypothetical protein PILCRDRAFT_11608 [Piloderma croceum F 1598]
MRASDANQISRLCNPSCRAPTSNITPLVNAPTGEDIQNFPVTVAAIRTMNVQEANRILGALDQSR